MQVSETCHAGANPARAIMENTGSFSKFAMPIIRKVFPSMIANELVKVQPMSAPSGQIFTMDYDKKEVVLWVCKWFINGTVHTSAVMSKTNAYRAMMDRLKERICAWIEPEKND